MRSAAWFRSVLTYADIFTNAPPTAGATSFTEFEALKLLASVVLV